MDMDSYYNEQREAARKFAQHFRYKIIIWQGEGRATIEYTKVDDVDIDIDTMVNEPAYQLAAMLQGVFHMQGEVETRRLPRYE